MSGLPLCTLSLVASLLSRTDGVPGIEEIRANYVATVSSMHSLESRSHYLRSLKRKDPDFVNERTNLLFWKQGTLRALQYDLARSDGEIITWNWVGFDGQTYATWTSQGPATALRNRFLPFAKITANRQNYLYEEVVLDVLMGEMLVSGSLSLAELLKHDAIVSGWESVDGVRCIKVRFPRHMRSRFQPERLTIETTAWFDPAVRYLPRRIVSQDFVNGDAVDPVVSLLHVTEFQEVDGADGQRHVVPRKAERQNVAVVDQIVIDVVEINKDIPARMFSPQFPDLTQVTEELPGQARRVRVVGSKQERSRKEVEILKSASSESGNEQDAKVASGGLTIVVPAPDASPRAELSKTAWISRGLLLFSSVSLVLAWISWRKHSSERTG